MSLINYDSDDYFDEDAENSYIAQGQSMLNELRSTSSQQQQQPSQQQQQPSQQEHPHQQQSQQVQDHERTSGSAKNWEIDLIEEVRRYDCLWNVKCRAFKETPQKK